MQFISNFYVKLKSLNQNNFKLYKVINRKLYV